ncbi:copia-type polyprotein, partial [Trifolium medium]|nr:copia-type polyprotein [Trifolium medium]
KDSNEEQALKISNGGRGFGRGRGRSSSRGRGRGRQSKELVECFKCRKLGHYQNECPSWEDNANYAEFDDEEETLLMAKTEGRSEAREEVWYLDSGCSNHMIGNKQWLFDFDESFKDSVKLGNDSKMQVEGKGSLKLLINGKTHVITNVYYLPGLRTNLLSIGQLQQKNVTIVFKNDTCKAYHDEKGLIFTTQMSANRMYIIVATVVIPMCLQMTKLERTQLWHNRYGHLSINGLKLLAQKEMVKGLPELGELEEKCPDCMIGKQHRDAIPKQAKWRATAKLQLVHSDICGPINPTSNGGKRYFITFTDDYSRKTWVNFLKEKSDAFDSFKNFKVMVEKESNCMIQTLRTDRGGEYTSNAFNEFCNSQGIKRQLTAAYTPQQNGVSERKNRTLLNIVRSMLSSRNVPKRFWPEAVKWATYVMNRCPTLSVKNMTPEEAWSDIKPSVHHFRVFGCIAYVHVADNQRKKLDNKSIKCVFLGISDESKAYKLYEPSERKIIVSRDVVFEESKGWDWENKEKHEKEEVKNDLSDDEETAAITNDVPTQTDNGFDEHNDSTEAEDNDQSSEEENILDREELPPRTRKLPARLKDFVIGSEAEEEQELHNLAVYSSCEDPNTYDEASKSEEWRKAMDMEIESIEKNNTWELTSLPTGSNVIGVKWIYKTKYNEKGQIEKYKARLVAKGYTQRYGIDYNEVFAPVARWDTIRTVLALAASKGWNVFQLDVKSAFLHGELTEDIYVEQPLGYQKGDGSRVYKLKKALYGLKQAPRAWYSKIESYFNSEKFEKCPSEHTLFVKQDSDNDILIVSIYVDDLIYTGSNKQMITNFKESMQRKFAMTDLGKMRYFLGIEVSQTNEGIFIHQLKYATELLARFGMDNCNTVCSPIVTGCKLVKNEGGKASDAKVYKQMVGSLMYLLATRPDLAFSVCLVARFMERPTEMHVAAIKRIMRYLKGTTGLGIMYKREDSEALQLKAWSDSDYAGDLDDRKSTSGYVFKLGSGAISWSSKKQPIVTLSTTEAEFVAAASCACQGIWLRNVLSHLKIVQSSSTVMYCDNSSSIKLSKNPILHGRCKHIDVRFHFLRDLTKDGVIELVHCSSQDQFADIMTKPLKLEAFCKLRSALGMLNLVSLN